MNTHMLIGPIQLFLKSWQFYKSHWKILTTIIVLPYGGVFIGNLFSQIAVSIGEASSPAVIILSIIGVLVFLASIVFSVAASAALIRSVHSLGREAEHKVHLWQTYRIGLTYFWPLLLIGVMRVAGTFGATVVFVIPGIIFSVYSAFVLYSLVIDNKRGVAAFTDSFSLVYARWWKVLGRIIIIALAYILALLVLTGVSFLIQLIFGYSVNSVADGIVKGILMSGLSLVSMPLVAIYLYNLFEALKTGRAESKFTKLFKDLFITCMVIGAVICIAAVVLGAFFSPDKHQRRAPFNSSMALSSSLNTHGNLVV